MTAKKKAEKEDEELVASLERWVEEHPEDAEVKHINLTTMREFTIKEIYEQLKEAQETGVAIIDEEVIEVKEQIRKWVGG